MNGTSIVSRAHAVYALVIIFVANFINYTDRILVSAVLSRISKDFDLSDLEAGVLWAAFTVGYMLTAPFIGYLSDHKRRTTLLGICIALWSLATIGTGLAPNFVVLVLMRVVTGIGEAGCLIIGPTLISDYFPKAVRGKVLAVFYLGLPLGGTFGFLFAGMFASWQNAFFAAGAPGLLIALLAGMLKEPVRGGPEGGATVSHHAVDFSNLKSYLGVFKSRTLLYIALAQAAAIFTLIPLIHFGEKYLVTVRGVPEKEARYTFGALFIVGGLVGNFLGGSLGDKWFRTNKAAYSLVAGMAILAGFPFLFTALLCDVPWIYTASLLFCGTFFFACMPAYNTQIANVTSPAQRSMAYAAVVFTVHILGDTVSPIIFGGMSKAIGMQRSFEIFTVMLILSGLFCFLAARHAKADAERAERLHS